MKTVSLMLVLLLVFLLVPGDIAMSNDKPYRPIQDQGVDDGDDHPWGGENRAGGGVITSRALPPRVSLGVVILDYIFRVPLFYERTEVAMRQIERKLSPLSGRPESNQFGAVHGVDNSPNNGEGESR